MQLTVRVVDTLAEVARDEWQALAGLNPFVSYDFLRQLEASGCAAPATGWVPRYLLLERDGRLSGAAATYLKSHSRGEFVFDQGWAEAFERHGLEYYPKLLVAAPFTPVQGPRLLAVDEEAREVLAQAVLELTKSSSASSAHVLFVQDEDRRALLEAGFMLREGVQFHWTNNSYRTVDDFLAQLTHDKRKKIRQDSKYVASAGIRYQRFEGAAITTERLRFFYSCYANTYREHWSRPYLTLEFFTRMQESGALHMVLVVATRDEVPVACALNVLGDNILYGRYWGTTEFVRGLHFDTCYLQAIAFCIERGISTFEGGAQGEHKMARGLMPVKTYSAHWVRDRRFSAAIEEFLQRETTAVDEYVDGLGAATPFKRG
jgi:predicted N-acyltransferase